ncbi:MAG TPA: pilin [Candidatus Saccharimonadales bacterium]
MKKSFFALRTISVMFVVFVVSGFIAFMPFAAVHAAELNSQKQAVCEGAGGWVSGEVGCAIGSSNSVENTLRAVADILIFIIGAIAVIMIIIGGIRYATSGGDQAQITSAKNTILYSVIGLVVAFMSYGIARFIADRL